MIYLILFCAFITSIFAEDTTAMISMENDPSSLVEGKVSVITGDLVAYGEDLVVQGVEPIRITRAYIGSRKNSDIESHWDILDVSADACEWNSDVWVVAEKNGTPIYYKKVSESEEDGRKRHKYTPFSLSKGYSNTSQGEISSRTNLRNNYAIFEDKHRILTLHTSNGSTKFYHKDKYSEQYRLLEEKLPNGNWVIYEYEKTGKRKKPAYNLVSIQTTNLDKSVVYARADLIRVEISPTSKKLRILGSDGQIVEYIFEKEDKEGSLFHLESIKSSQDADLKIGYTRYKQELRKHRFNVKPKEEFRLCTLLNPLDRKFEIDYYKRDKETVLGQDFEMKDYIEQINFFTDPLRSRVKSLASPVGSSMKLTHQFIYDLKNSKTSVYDIEENRTDYFWGTDCRIQKIEYFSKDGRLDHSEKFRWSCGTSNGNLSAKTFLDCHGNAVSSKSYKYDLRGNVLEEKFYGNLSGTGPAIGFDGNDMPISGECSTKKSSYTASEPNLLLEKQEESGLRVTYDYLAGTDLKTAEITWDKDQIRLRKFWEYNKDNILIREIADDGASSDKQCMTGVMTRTIREYTLIDHGKYIGIPSCIEEKYWENGCEILLRRIVASYTKGCKIAQQDVYDADNRFCYQILITYDEKGRVLSQTNALGQVQTVAYDLCGNPIESRDFSGKIKTEVSYDKSNNQTLVKKSGIDNLLKGIHYTYDNKHNLVKESTLESVDTLYSYSPFGKRIETKFPDIEARIQAQYDSAGNQILSIDAEGHETKTTFNAYGKPVSICHPDGAVETYIYNLDGTVKTYTDPIGIVASFEYDFMGRVLTKRVANQLQETHRYHGDLLISKIDAEGNETTYCYDGAGRKIEEKFAGETIYYQYDSLGRVCRVQKGDLYSISEHDLLGRVIEERKESISGTLLGKAAYEYDEAGNKKTVIHFVAGNEAREEITYDSMNRVTRKKDRVGAVEVTAYLENFKNAHNQSVLQKTQTDPLGLTTICTYDTRGNIASLEKRKGIPFSLEEKTYNKNGKLSQQINTIFAPNSSSREIHTAWEYDARGRLKTLLEPEGKTTHHKYSLRGQLEQTTKPNGAALNYTYDDFGFNIALASSDGTVNHQMGYNKLGQLVSTEQIKRTLDPRGLILKERFPMQYEVENTYDAQGRRTECLIEAADCKIEYIYTPAYIHQVRRYNLAGARLYQHTYGQRDLSGNLLDEETLYGTTTYTVDPLSRKTSIRSEYFNQNISEFDAVGNILSMNIQDDEIKYTYDDLYQLTSEDTHTYSHDSLNNRIQKDGKEIQVNDLNQDITHFEYSPNGTPSSQGKTHYTYDALDRLISIQSPSTRQTFIYDFLNRCLSKTSGSRTQHYLYDGQNEIGSFDDSLNLQEFRVLGATPHAEIGASIAIELPFGIYSPIHDLQGNIAALISRDHLEEPSYYKYTAFGEEEVWGHAPTPWRYASKRTDADTGLVYFGRRFYSPKHGRWLSPDPAGFTDGMNLYAYVHNAPLTHSDEYGLIAYDYRDGWVSTPWNAPNSLTAPRYFDYERPKTSPYNCFSTSFDPYPKGTPIYYLNGIQNTEEDNRSGARKLLGSYGNQANVIPFYSESFGKIRDLWSVHKSTTDDNYTTSAIKRLNREIRFHIYLLEAMNDPRKVFVTCFSRGATDAFHALKTIPSQQRDKLIITACGPIMVLPRALGHIVTNMISEGDWCSSFCNPGLTAHKDWYDSYSNLNILKQIDGFSGFNRDHFFESATYQKEIMNSEVPLYKKHGFLH